MPTIANYRGIIPAIACPFTAEGAIDEPSLRRLASWLASHQGVVAVMTNGHTGEVFSLTPLERTEVTRIVADELRGKLPVISSIVCEGLSEAADHARLAKEAGAAALDVMPPHHWLRFGFHAEHALAYFENIWQASKLDLVCHVYPAYSKASYSSALLADLARLPYVQAFKVGQREMSKYARDLKAIREADATKAILTCHDEYLLASMIRPSRNIVTTRRQPTCRPSPITAGSFPPSPAPSPPRARSTSPRCAASPPGWPATRAWWR